VRLNRKYILLGIVVSVIITVALIVILDPFMFSYTKVKVVEGQTTSITLEGNTYKFQITGHSYNISTHERTGTYFKIFSGKQSYDCSAIEGKRHTTFGIQVIVSEVAWDYIVLLVKSL
jgi:hypothetical protein